MKILFNPQVRDNERIIYKFEENRFKATHKGKSDTFDFTDLPDGELQIYDDETKGLMIETELEENPIMSARKEDGTLYVELINFIDPDATESERFPGWIDHTEYITPEPTEAEAEAEEEVIEETAIEEGEVSG